MASSENIISSLSTVLADLTANPSPSLPSPPETARRGAVALIIRINPSFSHWPPVPSTPPPTDLATFFAQPWTQRGAPEILFIKRAARKTDRWASHIAFPGGMRDPSDDSDFAAAVRETSEEVGLDLQTHAISCGNLPQRLVTSHWGRKSILVLCPYVFLLTTHHALPPLRLQPTEVASTHWVPLTRLMDPQHRSLVFENVSSRLSPSAPRWLDSALRMQLGKMMLAAIQLHPTESLSSPETLQPLPPSRPSLRPAPSPPLLLWGLTLGVLADLLALLPPHNALNPLWAYPTFTRPDLRLAIAVLTASFPHRARIELQAGTPLRDPNPVFGSVTESAIASPETVFNVPRVLQGYVLRLRDACLPHIDGLPSYYTVVRRAVLMVLVLRALAVVALGRWGWLLWRARGSMMLRLLRR